MPLRDTAITLATRLLGVLLLPGRLLARRDNYRPRRVLFVKPCCFGDVIMATAAVEAMARAYPKARFSFLVGDWSKPAVAANPRIGEIIDAGPVGTTSILRSWREYLALARRLRSGRFDTALVLDRSPLLGLLCWLAGIRVRAGLDSAGRGFALTHPTAAPPDKPRHEVEWYLDVVRALGVPVNYAEARTEFVPSPADEAGLRATLGEVGLDTGNVVMLHVGGGANPGMRLAAKRWTPQGWITVLRRLLEAEPGVQIALAGGPSDEDRGTAATIKAGLGEYGSRVFDLSGRLGWGELGSLASRARLYLGPDTGATHLAVAAGAPVVAVFGPSDPRRYRPWNPAGKSKTVGGTQSTELLAQTAAALAGVSYHESVAPDEVWHAVCSVLGITANSPAA